MNKKKIWQIVAVATVVLGAVILIVGFFPPDPGLKYAGFAKCLAVKGLVMYGSATCPHCQSQKAMFDEAFKYINYVECSAGNELCVEKNIQSVPTWDLPTGERILGAQPLKELSRLSGCPLPE